MDLFNPFSPTSVLRDYKIGADMAHLQLPLESGEVQLLYIPRRNPDNGELEADEDSIAAKWHTNAGELEVDIMAAKHFRDHLLGVGATGYLGGAAWRFDVVYTLLDESEDRNDFLQFVVNLDYAWQWSGRNVYGIMEYYHNALGRSDAYDQALTDEPLVSRLERGEIFTLGRNYLSGRLQYELHPLVQPSAAAIINIDDPSLIFQPQLAWDIVTNLQLIAGATLFFGGDDTEFGGFDTMAAGSTVRIAPADSYYLWLTYYF